MSVFLDIAIIFLILFFVIRGYKNGFIMSALSFLNIIISFVVSMFLSDIVSDFVYLKIIKPNMILKISDSIMNGSNSVDGILNFLPSFMLKVISSEPRLISEINNAIYNNSQVAPSMVAEIISPVIVGTIKIFVSFILFAILGIILKMIKSTISGVLNISLLRGLDSILGAAFGGIKGLIAVIFSVIAIEILVMFSGNGEETKFLEIVNNTSIFRVFYDKSNFNSVIENI